MMRFWWRTQSIQQQIAQLSTADERSRATAAYTYLMRARDSSYKEYVTNYGEGGGLLYGFPEVVFLFLILFFFLMF